MNHGGIAGMVAAQVAPAVLPAEAPPGTLRVETDEAGRPRYVVQDLRIGPNSEAQKLALSSPADIVIEGGAAGGGKSRNILTDPLRYIYPMPGRRRVHNFTGVVFRRTSPMITNEGGLWDESMKLYGQLQDATPVAGNLEWRWPGERPNSIIRPTIRFAHLVHEDTVYDWQGAQLPWWKMDELTHFTRHMFFYMLSRTRSDTGIRGRCGGGCNPDADSWVADFIGWWIDQRPELVKSTQPNPNYGLPLKDRIGKLRWFAKPEADVLWADSKEELLALIGTRKLPGDVPPEAIVKSMTFIPYGVTDNIDLARVDPGYIANLMLQDHVERERLLAGNWKVRPAPGLIFPRDKLGVPLPVRPRFDVRRRVRYWDKAGTEGSGDWSVGTLLALMMDDSWIVEDVVRAQLSSRAREVTIEQTAISDGRDVAVVVEQEPGSGGKQSAEETVFKLGGRGVEAYPDRPTGPLVVRSRSAAAQWQAGNVRLVEGAWNGDFIRELNAFDGKDSTATVHDDQVASFTGAYNWLSLHRDDLGEPDDWATAHG